MSLTPNEQKRFLFQAFPHDIVGLLPFGFFLNCRSGSDRRRACNGECPRNRFERTREGEPGLNYLCKGYQRFFRHAEPYMDFMRNELMHRRAPANVMEWARKRMGDGR